MAKIDPAFQAAPVLQDTYNPVEFAQQAHQEKFQLQKAKYEEHEKQTAEGLKDLMLNLKGWEDKSGFQELLERQQKAIDGFMSLSRKGMNLVNPKSTEEVMAYKALTDYHVKTKQLADTWTQQKGICDLYHKALEEDSKLSPDEQKIDHAASEKNIQEALANNTIEGRAGKLQDLLVSKPTVGDVHKYVKDNLDMITKPNKVQMPYTDPNTGQQGSIMNEVVTPQIQKKQVADLRNLYNTAPSKIKNGIKQARKEDPTNDSVMSDQDYFVAMYNPKFKQQMIDKITSKAGSGLNIDFKVGNAQIKMSRGEHNKNESPIGGRQFNDRYDFTTNKSFQVSTVKGEKAESMPDEKEGTTGWAPIDYSGRVKAQLQFYDVKSKQLIFKADETEDMPYMRKNSMFAVPVENVPEAMDFPITKDDGKQGTLKDVFTEVQNFVTKNSGIQWK